MTPCPAWPRRRWACPSFSSPPPPAWSLSPASYLVSHTGRTLNSNTTPLLLHANIYLGGLLVESFLVYSNTVSLQPALLGPAGPDGGWTSCLPPLLRGGGIRQLGSAPPHLLGARADPAPVVPGVSQQPSGVSSRQQPPPAAVRPEPRQRPPALRGGAVVAFQGQDG